MQFSTILSVGVLFSALGAATTTAAAQMAIKPTVMVVPSNNYMFDRGFCTAAEIDGVSRNDVCDIGAVLLKDPEFKSVVAAVSAAFQDRGYTTQQLEMVLANLEKGRAEQMMASKAVESTPLDNLLNTFNPDILVQIKLDVVEDMGERRSSLIIEALDSYTAEPIASKQISTQPSGRLTVGELARAAVIAAMPEVEGKLMGHFTQMSREGRRVQLEIGVLSEAELEDGLDTDVTVGGQTVALSDYLTDKIRGAAVNGQFQPGMVGEKKMVFQTVNVPFGDVPRSFFNTLARTMSTETGYRIRMGTSRGLGMMKMTIGRKAGG